MLNVLGRQDVLDSDDAIPYWLETKARRRPPRTGDRTRSPHTCTRFMTATILLLRSSAAQLPLTLGLIIYSGVPGYSFFVLMNVYPALYDM